MHSIVKEIVNSDRKEQIILAKFEKSNLLNSVFGEMIDLTTPKE